VSVNAGMKSFLDHQIPTTNEIAENEKMPSSRATSIERSERAEETYEPQVDESEGFLGLVGDIEDEPANDSGGDEQVRRAERSKTPECRVVRPSARVAPAEGGSEGEEEYQLTRLRRGIAGGTGGLAGGI